MVPGGKKLDSQPWPWDGRPDWKRAVSRTGPTRPVERKRFGVSVNRVRCQPSKSTPGPHAPGAGAGPQTQASGTRGSLRKDLAVTSGGRTVPPRTDLRSLAENVLGGGPSRRVGVVGNWVTQIPGNPEVTWLTR